MSEMALVLITTEIGSEERVLGALKKIDGVDEAYRIYGAYDTLIKIKAKNMDDLKKILTFHVRKIDGVYSTLTLVVM